MKEPRHYVLTRQEVADIFGIVPRTVTSWERKGLLKRLPIPFVRFLTKDVEQLFKERNEKKNIY